jgi:hypothetical protein
MAATIVKHYCLMGYEPYTGEYLRFLWRHGCIVALSDSNVYFNLKLPDGTKINKVDELEHGTFYQVTLPDGTRLAATVTRGSDIYSTTWVLDNAGAVPYDGDHARPQDDMGRVE